MANLTRKVTLSIAGNLADIQAKLGWVKAATDDIKKGATVPIGADTKPISTALDKVRLDMKALTDKVATVKIGADDKEANAKLSALNYKLTSLDKRVSEPRVSLLGVAKAQADLAALDLSLDRLGSKNVTPNAGGGGGIGGALSGGLSNPYVAGGAADVGIIAAPFIGQAIGGGLTAALGLALAGIGIYAATKLKPVQKSFDDLKKNASADLIQIGKPFAPVMESIFSTAQGVLRQMTPVFAGAEKTISGPFKKFADTLLNSFKSPAVATSINAVAGAFGKILTNLSPSLPGMINEIANAITAIANNISKNPGAFNVFIHFLVTTVQWTLNVINFLTVLANYIEGHFNKVIRAIGAGFVSMAAVVVGAVGLLLRGVLNVFGSILHGAVAAFGWVPWWGGQLRNASKNFDNFERNTLGSLDNVKQGLDQLAGSLTAIPANKFIHVSMRGDGTFTVTGINNVYTYKYTAPGGTVNAYRVKAAATGAFINTGTGPTADDVLVRASKGELIVPAKLVNAGAVDHLKGLIPGFSTGGLIGLPGQMYSSLTSRMLSSMENAMAAARGFANGGLVRNGYPVGASMAAAGVTVVNYNVNVNPTATAHPADIGRQVVNAIKEFEKTSGHGWRK
jgi:hypothetical protein